MEGPQRLLLTAYTNGLQVTNNPLCCAERRLISMIFREAEKNGVKKENTVKWIHRKYKNITIERYTSNGIGNSFPCIFCRKSLEMLDMRVTCYVDEEFQCVRIKDSEYKSKYTTGQMLKNQPRKPCVVQSSRLTRRLNRELKYSVPGKVSTSPFV